MLYVLIQIMQNTEKLGKKIFMRFSKDKESCLFCNLPSERIIKKTKYFNIIKDLYPISKGHTLITSINHYRYLRDLPEEAVKELWSLVIVTQKLLMKEYVCSDFNIGINDGPDAGRSVHHLHIHLIPRRSGDMENPRGGVRGVIPEKQKYVKKNEII